MERRTRIVFWMVLAGAALLLLPLAGSLPLVDPDEARFARTSVEMLRSHDLVVPTFEGQPRLVKPPLLHWIQSVLFGLLGPHEWVARLHATVATLGVILLACSVAVRRFGGEGAIWAAVALGTMPLVLLPGRLGTLDALLSLHVFAVVALDLLGQDNRAERSGLRSWLVGALLGLGFLVKGPVAVILPLLIVLAGRTASRREVLPSWGNLARAAAGWSLVVLPWGLALLSRTGSESMVGTVHREVLERYFAGTDHVEPFWFYLPVLVVGLMPWAIPVAIGTVRAFLPGDEPAPPTARYAAAGLVVGVLFFSLGRGKLPTYVLPLAPLAAILLSWELGRELARPRVRTLGPSLLAATLGALAVGFGMAADKLDGGPQVTAWIGAAVYGTGTLVCLPWLVLRRPRRVYATAAVAAALFMLAVVVFLAPALVETRTSAYLLDEVPELRTAETVLVVDMKVPSLTFYLDRAPEQVDMAHFAARLQDDDDPLIVFDEDDLPNAPADALATLTEVGRQGKYVVYRKP